MRPLLIAAAFLLLLILGKVFFWSGKSDKKLDGKDKDKGKSEKGNKQGNESKPIKVNTILVGIDNSDKIVFSSGNTVANEEVELKSEASGKIIRLNFPEGAVVQKGQLIAKIKDDDILAQLKKIDVEEKLADQIEQRQKKLLEINAISKEEYEITQNKQFALNADKEILKVQLARTEIRAPFSGKLGLKSISVGAYVTPATVIATIIQYNPIKIDFSIPEKYIPSVRIGSTIDFQINGSNDKFIGKIVALDPKIDENLRTLKVRAINQNTGNRLLPGMFLKVLINLGSEKSIMIPSETVIPSIDGKRVFIKRNGIVEEIKIETGLRTESKLQVLKGLNIGDSLIVSGLMTLKAGSPVFTKQN